MYDNQDSQDGNITYKRIRDRAKDCALERMPELPTLNVTEAWEAFEQELDDLDVYDIAYECSDWDWVIYYARAMELCQAVPSDVLHVAEQELDDMGGPSDYESGSSLYGLACQLAGLIVTREIVEALEEAIEEMRELATTQLDNLNA